MNLEMRLEPVQKPVLSQRMIQSMDILHLPILNFEERIDAEYLENPLLESDENASDETAEDSLEGESDEDSVVDSSLEDNSDPFKTEIEDRDYQEEVIENSDPEYADPDDRVFLSKDTDFIHRNREEDMEQYLDYMNSIPSKNQTLKDSLIEQLCWFDIPNKIRNYAEEIIYYLDQSGYLVPLGNSDKSEKWRFDRKGELGPALEELFGNKLSKEETSDIGTALSLVQSLEPKGVGARTLEECLLLQISPDDPDRKNITLLIKEHLKDLSENRLLAISKQTGLSLEEISFLLKKIQCLKEDPGNIFDSNQNAVINPDIIVEKDHDGNWKIHIEEGKARSLHLNMEYVREMRKEKTTPEEKKYIREKIDSARWFLDMIKQRKITLYNVVCEILKHQKDFLEKGPKTIHPLILKQIAEKINVHPSTVSRACHGKWMQTPFGIFPLKYFFTGAISAADNQDDAVAQNTALLKLQEIINLENPSNPFSDDELVKKMQTEGISLSRRTITKYRKIKNIPNSRLRKKW